MQKLLSLKDFESLIFSIVAIVLTATIAGCSQQAPQTFHATDITGVDWGKDFELKDTTGKIRRLNDFSGKLTVLYFGYTHCPDICPTALVDFHSAKVILENKHGIGNLVQILFVTIDPERDTPAVLKNYIPFFDESFIGLSTSVSATQALAKEFHLFMEKRPADKNGGYAVDHSAQSYVFDVNGRLRLLVLSGSSPEEIAHDWAILLKERNILSH